MNLVKSFSLKSFFWIFIMMFLLAASCIAFGFWIWRFIFSNLSMELLKSASTQSPEVSSGLVAVLPFLNILEYSFVPVVSFIFLAGALILWVIIRRLFVHITKNFDAIIDLQHNNLKSQKSGKRSPLKLNLKDMPLTVEDKPSANEKKEDMELNQKFYLHMISVLQREGRLLDFFFEDLTQYGDSQIGAAVRNIHENCKKALNKYLKPIAIIDKNEGDSFTVPKDFDVNTIKLTGNVINEPPFQGVLRHKGWQVSKLELPTLTSGQNPRIIAPAEVEIV
jgi:hypothetical protein